MPFADHSSIWKGLLRGQWRLFFVFFTERTLSPLEFCINEREKSTNYTGQFNRHFEATRRGQTSKNGKIWATPRGKLVRKKQILQSVTRDFFNLHKCGAQREEQCHFGSAYIMQIIAPLPVTSPYRPQPITPFASRATCFLSCYSVKKRNKACWLFSQSFDSWLSVKSYFTFCFALSLSPASIPSFSVSTPS